MEISTIMKRLEDSRAASSAGVKTASVTAEPSTTSSALRTALREAVQSVEAPREKTASANTDGPVGDMMKFASDLAQAEEEALLKQAQLLGSAVCDGFVARLGQYEKTASSITPQTTKTAAAQVDGGFEKFASENPELVKEAYDLGYRTKLAQLEKEAAEAYDAGYNDTLNEVHKLASDTYKVGAATAQNLVRQVQQQR